MNILFYTGLFIIGIIIGCYWNIKTEEIPKNLDLKRKYYSKNPNQKILSKLIYMVIGGISSVVLGNVLKVNIHEIDVLNITIYIFAMLYISTLVVIAGIDKNYLKIDKKVIAFGIVTSIIYMIYLFVIDLVSVHLNIIYLTIYMILLLIDSFLLRKFAKDSYIVNILMVLAIILAFTDLRTLTYTVVMAVSAIGVYSLILKAQNRKSGNSELKISQIPVGYFITVSNIVVIFMIRIFEGYLI